MKKVERNAEAQAKNNASANETPFFTIEGRVRDTYQGKKRQFVTVRNTNKEGYYTDFNVSCDKDIEFENNELLRFNGTILAFFDKNANRMNYVFLAETIEEVTK